MELQDERMVKQKELIKEYDKKNEYYPKLKLLREECEKEGHERGNYHDNGLGWEWFYCSKCGTIIDKNFYRED